MIRGLQSSNTTKIDHLLQRLLQNDGTHTFSRLVFNLSRRWIGGTGGVVALMRMQHCVDIKGVQGGF